MSPRDIDIDKQQAVLQYSYPHKLHLQSPPFQFASRDLNWLKLFIGRFQAIKTDVLLIFSFITGDKTEFLSPMMFSNEYITGI